MTTRRWMGYLGVLALATGGTVGGVHKVRSMWRGPGDTLPPAADETAAARLQPAPLQPIPLVADEPYGAAAHRSPAAAAASLPGVDFAPHETRSPPVARAAYESPAGAESEPPANGGGAFTPAGASPYSSDQPPADEQPPAPLVPPPASFATGQTPLPGAGAASPANEAYDPTYASGAAPAGEAAVIQAEPPANPSRFEVGGRPESVTAPPPAAFNSGNASQLPEAPSSASERFNRLRGATSPVGEAPLTAPSPVRLGEPSVPAQPAAAPEAGLENRAHNARLGEPLAGPAGQGAPGARQLEGPQTPSLVLEKVAPQEIQVGKPASFQIKVRNIGQAAAEQVVVHDQVPRGTRLIDTAPRASRAPDGSLAWQIGSLPAGGETTLVMQLVPEQEGEIGSVATVSFQAQVSVRTVSTKPQLVIEHELPETVLIGETTRLLVRIANRGSGAATGLVVEEDVPSGLSHAAGRELEYEIGTLRPGEERRVELMLKAEQAGPVENVLVIRGEGGLLLEDRARIEVIAPQLELGIAGPKVRYLERPATYALSLANPGTAAAKEVEVVAHLPRGLKFVAANQHGQYDPQTHAVFWSLAELPPQQTGQVELTALPIEQGEHKLRVEGKGERGLTALAEQLIAVEGLAAIFFEVTDMADPIEVGKDTVYQVKVLNQGSKAATNIQLVATLPVEMKAIAGEGPTRVSVDGPRAMFEPLPRLGPGETAVYKLQARGLQAGDLRIRMQITTDELAAPVTKEESTRVYADE